MLKEKTGLHARLNDIVFQGRLVERKDRAAESNAGQLGAAEGMQTSLYADLVTISLVSLPHILCWLGRNKKGQKLTRKS